MESRNIHFKTIDTSTMEGFERAVKFHSQNPDWKLVSKSFCDFEWLFEKVTEQVSNCCSAKIIEETDVCSKCYEHCKIIEI